MDGYFRHFSLKAKHLKNQTSYSIRSSMEEIVQKLQLSKKQLMWSNLNLKIFSKRFLHHHLWSVLIWFHMEVSYFSGLPERRCCTLQSWHNFDGQVLSIFLVKIMAATMFTAAESWGEKEICTGVGDSEQNGEGRGRGCMERNTGYLVQTYGGLMFNPSLCFWFVDQI